MNSGSGGSGACYQNEGCLGSDLEVGKWDVELVQ